MFELIHFLHIVSGVTWGGAAIIGTLVWIPALQALEPAEIGRYFAAAGRRARKLMGPAALLTILTGLARAYLGGGVRSIQDLWSSYGLLVLAALAIFIGIRVYGIHSGKESQAAIRNGDDPRPALQRKFAMDVLVYPGGVLVLLGIMVIMRMGLY